MKLSDFSKKRTTYKRQKAQFILKNEFAENKYKEQIDDLNKQIGYLRNLEAERDDAIRVSIIEKEKTQEIQKISDQLEEKLKTVNDTLDFAEKKLNKIPELEEQIKSTHGSLSSVKNELDIMTKTAFEQSDKLSALGKQVESLKSENKQLTAESEQSKANEISSDEERNQVLEKNKKLEIFANETSKINKEVKNQNKELRDAVNYWEKEASESIVQLEQAIQVESKLRVWVSDLEKEEAINRTIKGETDKEALSTKKTMKEMGKVIEDLIKENKYVRNINKEYRKELLRPNYLSMASIAKQEGFKMPNGKENMRKQNLGNSMPTLLKFKAQKEETNA